MAIYGHKLKLLSIWSLLNEMGIFGDEFTHGGFEIAIFLLLKVLSSPWTINFIVFTTVSYVLYIFVTLTVSLLTAILQTD